jgi:hypothetical protein
MDGSIVSIFLNVMFFIVPFLAFGIIALVIAMIVSPKLRGKFMARQIKSYKYMMDEAKDSLVDIGTTGSQVGIDVAKNVMDSNKDTMKELASSAADISKDAITTTVAAVKEGITQTDPQKYCKYCGEKIDEDSAFCKYCGKEQ